VTAEHAKVRETAASAAQYVLLGGFAAVAATIVLDAIRNGSRLSQSALAVKLRSEGCTIANNRLRWLSSVSSLDPCPATEPDSHPRAGQ
jgi:hypothetical protein